MKKLLLSVVALAVYTIGNAQCSDLIISEYCEGSNNNKALEIYNPTQNTINLNNQYRLVRYNNGTGAAAGEANSQASVNLGTHIIHPGEAWVIVIDKRDPAGTGQEIMADLALQAVADTFLCPDYNVSYAMYFNGNDAVSLQKTINGGASWSYVDIFAKIGDAAMTTSNGWSDIFPYDGSAGALWTLNHTLIRKENVQQGITTNPTTFNVTVEWDSLPRDTWTNLGTHACTCPPASVNEIDNKVKVTVFPNPINNGSGSVNIVAAENILSVEIYNSMGQLVISKKDNSGNRIRIETEGLAAGIYSVKSTFDKNKTTATKLIIQ
jgi:hypothetical protein